MDLVVSSQLGVSGATRSDSIVWRLAVLVCATILGGLAGAACSRPEEPRTRPPVETDDTPTTDRDDGLADVGNLVRGLIEARRTELVGPLSPDEQRDLLAFYGAGVWQPSWTNEIGHPNLVAGEAIAFLAGVAADGLDSRDYATGALMRLSSALAAAGRPTAPDVAAFEASVSAALLRGFRHLHVGRVDPRSIGLRTIRPDDQHDYVAALQAVLEGRRIADVAAELSPKLELYRRLREALARYRSLAAEAPAFDLAISATIEPGQPFEDASALGQRLLLFGDISGEGLASGSPVVYDAGLVEGVKRFQRRHGLAEDGRIGHTTAAALNVPMAGRVRQIELALERLRWLPHLGPGRLIGVNVPMFRLWAWDALPGDPAPTLSMRVIVGRAPGTRTPVLASDMRSVVFRPYWNVPTSIARGELIPAWRRDSTFFDRHALEIVSGPSDDAPAVAVTRDAVMDVEHGRLRLRQRPGPTNSLGLVKFLFPNDENVYLHATPTTELFSVARRDFSHGCVRVEDPIALAGWVLRGQGDWTSARIALAMQGSGPLAIPVERRIQVVVFYVTAAVLPEDGALHFAADIYGHDASLDRALQVR